MNKKDGRAPLDRGSPRARARNIVGILKHRASPRNAAGMARFGINPKGVLGVSMPFLRALAKKHRRDQDLAWALWKTGIHEARILAALTADPARMDERTVERWARQTDSWDICDQLCLNLWDRVPGASKRALRWSKRKETFVKRAGFALMAVLAVHDKKASDAYFLPFLRAAEREAGDGRNFVKKAVNWALRQVGKRNGRLKRRAVTTARKILACHPENPSARWVALDALRELKGH